MLAMGGAGVPAVSYFFMKNIMAAVGGVYNTFTSIPFTRFQGNAILNLG